MIDVAMTDPRRRNAIRLAPSQICITGLMLLAGVMLAAGPDPAYAQSSDNRPGVTAQADAQADAKRKKRKNDLLVNRGDRGLWAFKNNNVWQKIDSGNPTAIAVGDINGDGTDDIIVGLAAPMARKGTWIRIGTTLTRIDMRPANNIAAGDFNGDGFVDLLATFQGVPGTHLWMNDFPNPPSVFFEVHPETAIRVAAGDLQGDGIDDAIIGLPIGLLVCYDGQSPWIELNPNPIFNVVLGNLDGDDRADLVIDRNGGGIWRSLDGGDPDPTWQRIDPRNPSVLATGDPDGNGRDGVFATLPGPNGGLWRSSDGGVNWTELSPMRPLDIAVGTLDAGTKDDVVAIFPGNTNIFARKNNAGNFMPLIAPPGAAAQPQRILFFAAD